MRRAAAGKPAAVFLYAYRIRLVQRKKIYYNSIGTIADGIEIFFEAFQQENQFKNAEAGGWQSLYLAARNWVNVICNNAAAQLVVQYVNT